MKLYVPDKIDLSKCPTARDYREDAYILFSIIYKQQIYRKKKSDFVNLKKEYLRKQINCNILDTLIKELIQAGIVESDNHYIKGRKCIGYRLNPKLILHKHKAVALKNKIIIKRLGKWYAKEQHPLTLEVHQKLRDVIHKLVLDRDQAERTAKRYYRYQIRQIKGLNKIAAKARDKVKRRYRANMLAIDMFCSNQRWLIPDDYGRVHSNVTSMSKCIRKLLTLNSESLVEIDVVNSQPLLLGMLYKQWLNGNKQQLKSLESDNNFNEFQQETNTHTTILHYDAYFLYHMNTSTSDDTSVIHGVCMSNDAIKYLEAVEHGELYENMMSLLAIEDRSVVKRIVFGILMGKHRTTKRQRLFANLYPSIYEFIGWLKKKDYKHASHALQRLESKIILHSVARQLLSEMIPCATIHDSLLVSQANVERTFTLLYQEYRRCANVRPSLKPSETTT